MKRFSFIILFICRMGGLANAQHTGYFIKNNNDTVRCYIKLDGDLDPIYRFYNAKHKARMRRISADTVKAFRVSADSSYFVARVIPITYKKRKLVFLQLVERGRINLYSYSTQFYYAASGREDYNKSLYASKGSDSLMLIRTGDVWPLKQTKLRNLFYSLISDEPQVAAAYMARDGKHSLFYNFNTIDDFISRYNKAAAAKK